GAGGGAGGGGLAARGGGGCAGGVPGVAQAPRDDAGLAAVLTGLLEPFDHAHVPADFTPYDAAEVARLRKQPLVDVEGTRARLLGEGGTAARPRPGEPVSGPAPRPRASRPPPPCAGARP